ncbi:MAG: hypothetical protein QF466_07450 [Desulfobacterales bacterium]|nr:hypothetical protein [Desulfobacterales bacterium]MDP6683594.1 hypothetical protein [Desulfobacterales bacterium]MDP6807925.1 hypothetical protein [Desulfobacterales bacterium]
MAISNGIHKVINHAQARDGLCLLVKSVASGMLTLKKFCAAVKALFEEQLFSPKYFSLSFLIVINSKASTPLGKGLDTET